MGAYEFISWFGLHVLPSHRWLVCVGFTAVCHAGGLTVAQYILWQPNSTARLFGGAIGPSKPGFGYNGGALLKMLS